jgi:integrase
MPVDAFAGARVNREKLQQVDLHWHDLRHEGACRLLAEGVDIRTIQLMLGHADIKQTQRYLNITVEELRKAMTGAWERRRHLRVVGERSTTDCQSFVSRRLPPR